MELTEEQLYEFMTRFYGSVKYAPALDDSLPVLTSILKEAKFIKYCDIAFYIVTLKGKRYLLNNLSRIIPQFEECDNLPIVFQRLMKLLSTEQLVPFLVCSQPIIREIASSLISSE